ncbi:VapE domain-containing protein [Larkinella insperata]|uniref:VapE domain-containing protein n=1 Tax=Larkinella insperata TaxID=332158 RepID=A0ABW3Q6A9_9BACT|nr:VapE domain-containing protein [Larkinella insperata]
MEFSQNSKQKVEIQPIIYRIRHYLFAEYDYRVDVVSNQLERKPKKVTEWELVNLCDVELELYECGLKGFKDALRALFGSKAIPRYDPFEVYFQSLPNWNLTQPDYIDILASYVKTEDSIWWKAMFKKWLVRCVGQAIGGAPFNKQCLTLVGKQNDGKTTFLDFLIPNALKNYAKKGFDFGSKEGKFSLVQNFMVNLDELASFDKKELNNEFKTVLSESIVKYRPLFQNVETAFQRRASFVASTNQFEFLTDETGNVRWLPFIVKEIQHDNGGSNGYMAQVNIDLVWSQAYALLKDSAFKQDMTNDETKTLELYNRKFLRTTTEMETISKFYEPAEKGEQGAEFYTAADIEENLRTKVTLKLYRNQIGKALQILGFNQVSTYNTQKKYTEKGYYIRLK